VQWLLPNAVASSSSTKCNSLSAFTAARTPNSELRTPNSELQTLNSRAWRAKFSPYARNREVRLDRWAGSGRGRRNSLAILRFIRLGWQTPRRYLSPERKLLVLLSSRHLHSDQYRSHDAKLVVQALACIARKSLEICERCRLMSSSLRLLRNFLRARNSTAVEYLPAKL